jgi:hypothetical protein
MGPSRFMTVPSGTDHRARRQRVVDSEPSVRTECVVDVMLETPASIHFSKGRHPRSRRTAGSTGGSYGPP